jgi:hypothetical protein
MSKKMDRELKELVNKIILECLTERFVICIDRAFKAKKRENFKGELLNLLYALDIFEDIVRTKTTL